MKIILFAFSLLLSLSIFAQQPRIVISSIKAPSHKKQYSINERIIVYYSDTCAVGGNINQISKEKIMIDSAFIPTNSIQYIVDYNKKNFWHKMGGIGTGAPTRWPR